MMMSGRAVLLCCVGRPRAARVMGRFIHTDLQDHLEYVRNFFKEHSSPSPMYKDVRRYYVRMTAMSSKKSEVRMSRRYVDRSLEKLYLEYERECPTNLKDQLDKHMNSLVLPMDPQPPDDSDSDSGSGSDSDGGDAEVHVVLAEHIANADAQDLAGVLDKHYDKVTSVSLLLEGDMDLDKLSLTASSLALALQRLELACAFLLTDRLWAVAMADLAQLAVGLHANTAQRRLLTTPSALSSPRPASLSPTASGPTAMGGQQGPGWVEKLEPFWQLFVTYVVEATAGTEHNLAWWMAAVKAGNAYLPDLVTPLQRAQPMNAKMLVGAAAQYVQEVRQQGEGGWEVLLAMAGRMRKRFRSTAAKIPKPRVGAPGLGLQQRQGMAEVQLQRPTLGQVLCHPLLLELLLLLLLLLTRIGLTLLELLLLLNYVASADSIAANEDDDAGPAWLTFCPSSTSALTSFLSHPTLIFTSIFTSTSIFHYTSTSFFTYTCLFTYSPPPTATYTPISISTLTRIFDLDAREGRSGPEGLRLEAGQLEGLEGEAWWGHCPDYALGTAHPAAAAASAAVSVVLAQVVSSLMQALVAAGEARCLKVHQQLGAACNVTSQGNGVTAAEQVSQEQAGEASVVVRLRGPHMAIAAAAAAQPQQASDATKACEAVLTKVNALLGTPSSPPAATQQQTRHGQARAQAAAAAAAAAQESRKGSEAMDTSRE
ncbi:hypothetical protein V8C86DRAFT_3135717 [Haematococcus lacustris]